MFSFGKLFPSMPLFPCQSNDTDVEKGVHISSHRSEETVKTFNDHAVALVNREANREYHRTTDWNYVTHYLGLPISTAQIKDRIVMTLTIPCKGLRNSSVSCVNYCSVEEYPVGYPRQAAFQSSEQSWSIYRSFNYLYSRVILELQDELRCLETELTYIDDMDLKNGDEKWLRSRTGDLMQAERENTDSNRSTLINAIREKLVNYGSSHFVIFITV